MFLMVANSLHIFNIDPILDQDGKTHDPFGTILDGIKMYVYRSHISRVNINMYMNLGITSTFRAL